MNNFEYYVNTTVIYYEYYVNRYGRYYYEYIYIFMMIVSDTFMIVSLYDIV